jgi:hypothetical protein
MKAQGIGKRFEELGIAKNNNIEQNLYLRTSCQCPD